jgi:hypothetical protein
MTDKPQAVVADLPDPIVEYQKSGKTDEEILIEPGLMAVINGKSYFIRCVATLPVKDFTSDLEFGLWVELEREDFFKYKAALDDDEKYKIFEAHGYLMNTWPAFPGTLGDDVTVKVINVNEKPFIVDINPSDVELGKYIEVGSMSDAVKQNVRNRIVKFYMPQDEVKPISDIYGK